MPNREPVVSSDCCALADRWGVSMVVLLRVIIAALLFKSRTGRVVHIISGFRTALEQERLRNEGRPTAPDNLSTHRSFPATGIDVSFEGLPLSKTEKLAWGQAATEAGLRWGGGSNVVDGIPIDWQHVDTGPRMA